MNEGPARPPPEQVFRKRAPMTALSSDGSELEDVATGAGVARGRPAVEHAKPDPVVADPAISERYRVIETLAPGPQDALYLAQRLDTGALVELRVLSAELGADRVLVPAFRQQATVVARLFSHCPGIATVYECERAASGALVLTMEHPAGPTLREVMRREGTLGRARALRLAIQIAEELERAHNLGLVHGGLRPENVVLVGPEERVVLTHFGFDWLIRSRSAGAQGGIGVAPEGSVYQAPEQALGQASRRSDVYAFGAILYEMLAGTPPSTGMAFRRVKREPLTKRRADVTPSLERIIMRSLEVEPARRLADISAMCNDLSVEVSPDAPDVERARSGRYADDVRRSGRTAAAPHALRRTGEILKGLGLRLSERKTKLVTLARAVYLLGYRLVHRKGQGHLDVRISPKAPELVRQEVPQTRRTAGKSPWAVVFRLDRYVRGLKVLNRGAVVGPRAGGRTRRFVVLGGLAVIGALAIWFADARMTSDTSTVSDPLARSAPTAVAPPSATAPVAVTAPAPADAPGPGAPGLTNAPTPDTPAASAAAGNPPESLPAPEAPSTSSPERSAADLRDSRKPQAGASSPPAAVTPPKPAEPKTAARSRDGAKPVQPPPRAEDATAAQRPRPAASARPEPSREAREAAQDPGAIIDWLLNEGTGQQR